MSDRRRDAELETQVLSQPDGTLRLRTRKLRVEVISGVDAGRVEELPGPEVRVGSSPSCNLTLGDATVSRHHLTLHVDAHGVRVKDAGSRNGTLLDGVRIVEAYARPDSSIVLGNTTLRLRSLTDVFDLPLSNRSHFGAMLGKSIAMRRAFSLLERVAPTDDSVLLEGETGTGKEIAAEAIHENSPRAEGPFVVFDCAAVAPSLFESELFGHVRGAFTGAVADRAGAFEQADTGTLFLDELGELPLEAQPKLLRVLERLEVRRVGGNSLRKVDVRLIAATNRSLENEVAAGRFREDLFYRLAVFRIELPPLRERTDDIPMLVAHFAKSLPSRGRTLGAVPEQVVRGFQERSWPGNVRELGNAVARVLSVGAPPDSQPPKPGHSLAELVDTSLPLLEARRLLIERFEREYISLLLGKTGGNLTRAAELAGVNRKFIQRAVKRYGLRGDED